MTGSEEDVVLSGICTAAQVVYDALGTGHVERVYQRVWITVFEVV